MAASNLIRPDPAPSTKLSPGVRVLVYHGVGAFEDFGGSPFEKKYWVDTNKFRGHLRCLVEAGYRERLLSDLWGPSTERNVSVEASAILTFDDGLLSCYEVALPMLQDAGLRAEFFVNTATIGSPGFLNWSQIIEMKCAGMSIQSHGHEHVVLPLLSTPLLVQQLAKPKIVLEDRLGSPVDFLAVPYGFINDRVIDVAMRVGYRAVCISGDRPARLGSRIIRRIVVLDETSMDDFQKLMSLRPSIYFRRRARATLAYLPKQILLRLRPDRLGVQFIEEGA